MRKEILLLDTVIQKEQQTARELKTNIDGTAIPGPSSGWRANG